MSDSFLNPMVPQPYRVRRKLREMQDVVTLELEPTAPDGEVALSFAPGQFNMLYAFGAGEVPISISGDPAPKRALAHTVRDVGAVTGAIARLRRGDVLGLRGPFGSTWPVENALGNDVVLVAGGIGLAPLRPAIYWLMAHRERYGRLILLYGSRSSQEMLYPRELRRWRSRSGLEVEMAVDRGTEEWRGHVGVVTKLISRTSLDPLNTVAMVCGPEVMMRFAVQELQNQGLVPERIFISVERNMKCAIGTCGHCQFGAAFVCKDGPVFRYDRIQFFFNKREV